ncbi:hypothetical protein QL285_020651 [Trifolium repens]|nr:hypothetical protein QL285_020651 [Trifolium repens]
MVFNEKCIAGSNFNDIADILPSREDVCIDVRVLRLWKVHAFLNPTETSSIEMVLVDKKMNLRWKMVLMSQYENGSPSLKKSYFKRQRKSTKNSLSTFVETLVYSRRKSCVKRKLNFDDGGDDVVSKTKPSKSCWVMLVVVRINEMLGYACGCVVVGGRIADSVVICFFSCCV